MENNQTCCGNGEGLITCDPGCHTDADCEGRHPNIPGMFSAKDTDPGNLCACPADLGPGFCVDRYPA